MVLVLATCLVIHWLPTCDSCDNSSCGCARQSKTCNGREGRVCIPGIGNDEGGAASSLIDPVVQSVFRFLVDGEGDGANKGYACQR